MHYSLLELELPWEADFSCFEVLRKISMPTVQTNTEALNSIYGDIRGNLEIGKEYRSNVVHNDSEFRDGFERVAIVYWNGNFTGWIQKPEIAIAVILLGRVG